MSSEIRTNLLKSRTGLSTVTLSDTGPVVTGISTFTGTINLPDNVELKLGDSSDAYVKHDQYRTILRQHGTGPFVVDLLGDNKSFEITRSNLSETVAKFNTNGSVDLFYDNTKRIETTNTGAVVTGILTANNVSVASSVTANKFYGDGSALTGISAGFSPDAQGNLVAGTNAGNSLDGSSAEYNILLGENAGESIDGDDNNIAIGYDAGKNNTASSNIFIGKDSAKALSSSLSSQNIFIGHEAVSNKASVSGTVVGAQAGIGNGTGINLTLFGYRAGGNSYNSTTFIGHQAGRSATSACDFTTAVGSNALYNIAGRGNVAIGNLSGQVLTSGQFNTLAGYMAGRGNLSGTINYTDCIAIGSSAAQNISSANNIIVIGANANPSSNTVTNEITLGNSSITKFRIPGLNYVNDAGKVGIGTTNPVYKLHVDSGDAAIGLWKSRRSSGSYIDYSVGANGAALGFIGAGGQILTGGADSGDFAIRSEGDLCFAAGGAAERARITSNGQVIISNSNPPSTGAMTFITDDGSATTLGTAATLRVANDGSSANYSVFEAQSGSGSLRLFNSGKLETKKTFTSSPTTFVHIGDDQGYFNFDMSDSSGGTDYIRHVKKRFVSKGSTGLTITSRSTLTGSYTKAGESSIKFSYPSAGGGNQAGGQLEFWTNQNGYAGTTEAKRMQIDNGGNIGAPTGNNIYNASDERLKENMVELTNGLDKIKKLKPISFNWKDGWVESLSGKKEYGFGAQTTQVVDEMLVEPFGTEDALLNGEVIKDPLRVNEKYITPLLVKAIQEQQEQIEILKQENLALRIRVTNLEDN